MIAAAASLIQNVENSRFEKMKIITELLDRCLSNPQMPFALFFAGIFLMIVERIGQYGRIMIPMSDVPVAVLMMTLSFPLICLTLYGWGLKKYADKRNKRQYLKEITESVESKMIEICSEIHHLDLDELTLMMIFSSKNYYQDSDGALPKNIVHNFGQAYPGNNPPLEKLLEVQLIYVKPIPGSSTTPSYSGFRYFLPSIYQHRSRDIDECLLKAARNYIKAGIESDYLTMMVFEVERKSYPPSGSSPKNPNSGRGPQPAA